MNADRRETKMSKVTAFPKYERYKDSGVEWLGEIPEHWEAKRVFSAFNERVERGNDELPILNISIKNGVQQERPEGDREQRTIEDRTAYKRAAAGDIAYNTMRMWQGAVGDVPVDGLISPAYVVARPIKDINTRYYSYLFRGEHFQVETNRHSYGIVSDRNRLYWLGFKNIVIPIPSRPDQDRIVTFLDRKTAEIDALIAKKQRQIKLLDEQKAILINRAVTQGLNPNAKLKPSGIEWIGGIPDHWDVKRLGAISQFTSGGTPSKERGDFWNGEIPWVSPKDMKRPVLDSAIDGVTAKALESTNLKLLPVYSLLIVVRGMILQRFVPLAVNSVPVTINQDMKGLVLKRESASSLFVATLLSACQAVFDQIVDEAGHGTKCIRTENLKSILLPIPPYSEQDEILCQIEKVRQGVDSIQRINTTEIQSLKTLRSTLIAHAVTGKIKV